MEIEGLDKYLPQFLEQMRSIAAQVQAGSTSMTQLREDFREHLKLYREDKKISDELLHSLEKTRDIANGKTSVTDKRDFQRPQWHTATGTYLIWIIMLLVLILDIVLRMRG